MLRKAQAAFRNWCGLLPAACALDTGSRGVQNNWNCIGIMTAFCQKALFALLIYACLADMWYRYRCELELVVSIYIEQRTSSVGSDTLEKVTRPGRSRTGDIETVQVWLARDKWSREPSRAGRRLRSTPKVLTADPASMVAPLLGRWREVEAEGRRPGRG